MYEATKQVSCEYCKAYGKKLDIKCEKCKNVYFCSEEHKLLDKHDCDYFVENKETIEYLTTKYYELGAYICPYIYSRIKRNYVPISVSLLETEDTKLAIQISSDEGLKNIYSDSIHKVGSNKIIELELGFIRGIDITIYTSHCFFPERKIISMSMKELVDKIKKYIDIDSLDITLREYKKLLKKK